MEGRHDGTLGMVHGRPAQAGHERLVDVQDVELLVFEHHVDVRQQVDRRRDVAHRAVVAHREGAAGKEVVRVGLVGCEQAFAFAQQHAAHALPRGLDGHPVVAWGDDRDAMTLGGEALGERGDVVVHAAGDGPRVRREHRDPVACCVHSPKPGHVAPLLKRTPTGRSLPPFAERKHASQAARCPACRAAAPRAARPLALTDRRRSASLAADELLGERAALVVGMLHGRRLHEIRAGALE